MGTKVKRERCDSQQTCPRVFPPTSKPVAFTGSQRSFQRTSPGKPLPWRLGTPLRWGGLPQTGACRDCSGTDAMEESCRPPGPPCLTFGYKDNGISELCSPAPGTADSPWSNSLAAATTGEGQSHQAQLSRFPAIGQVACGVCCVSLNPGLPLSLGCRKTIGVSLGGSVSLAVI